MEPALSPWFAVRDAPQRGLTLGRLRTLDAPFHGVRTARDSIPPQALLDRCRALAPRLAPGQFFSHSTALALHGVPGPWTPEIHVAIQRPAREPRTRGVIGHRLQMREAATVTGPFGLPTEDIVRAWRQCAWIWSQDDLIAAADHIVLPRNGTITIADLHAEVRLMGDHRKRLRTALDDVRVGSESRRETHLRLAIVRGGLPEPVLGYELFDHRGTFIARFDQCYPRFRVAVEYDGRQHAFDHVQFERDADRWAAISAAGWTLVRVLNHHLRGDGLVAVRMVGAALTDAGWKIGAPIA